VEALDGAGQRQGVFEPAAAGFRRRKAESRPDAFAAGEDGIPHGPVNGRRFGAGGRQKAV
jgi:hypothetical protein